MTEEEKIAIEYFKEHIAYFQEQIKFIEVVDCDYYDKEYELYKNRVKQFETILNLIQRLQKEYYCLINRIEDRIDKFDYEFNKAKRKNDNDRADYYWDLIINFKKLLESRGNNR